MEEKNSEQLKKDMSFDLYGRYAIIRDIINVNRDKQDIFRILDVGGRGNLLKKFLPGDDVFYLDPNVETEDDNYIEGDGCLIPREDNSFDFVVSADVFEHVPQSKREEFLSENIRVARLGVVLEAPFYSRETELAERFANDSYRVISMGDDHYWLKEHIDNGLPDQSEVEKYLNSGGYSFQVMHNNDLWLWEHLLCSSFVFLAASKIEKLKELNLFYNEKVYPQDHDENSYRTIFFIKKEKDLKDLPLSEKGMDTSLHLEVIKNNFSLLSQVYLEDREQIEMLKREGMEKEYKIALKKEEINDVLHELAQAQSIIEDMAMSHSWKMTEPFRAARRVLQKIIMSVKKT